MEREVCHPDNDAVGNIPGKKARRRTPYTGIIERYFSLLLGVLLNETGSGEDELPDGPERKEG
jgi:hypothetical protein